MGAPPASAIDSGTSTPADSGVDVDENGKRQQQAAEQGLVYDEDPFEDEEIDIDSIQVDTSDLTDNSVRILPGVRRMIDSIPKGRYAVATSGCVSFVFSSQGPPLTGASSS
jgi:transcriptional/translational regulatory protein YebC/TACO1